ncbi:family 16 glycosylhydrolase [Roseivirga sp. BDSF3-8]|uniref:family 16 glycosylhydrolase n=1 Tax=Roseivirga sp. BDSF3-8 TaxID=3241598 RepID=UPI0035318AA4
MKHTYLSVFFLLLINLSVHAQCPRLVWNDEFDGASLDLTKWEPMIGDGCQEGICGWGNNELQYYQSENAVVNNGTLKITAKKERVKGKAYTSARLRSKGLADFTFGRFEARIKLPTGQGLWPAFWMLSTNEPYGGWPQSGEIDIMEYLGQHPDEVFGTIHYGEPYPDNQFTGTDYTKYDGSTFAEDFHVFAIEWEPGVIRWYVDDVLYQTLTSSDVAPFNWPFDATNQMHFLLNVAVGGNLPGSPDETTPFPSTMEVDYVRVYEGGFNPSVSGDRLVAYQAAGESYTVNNAGSNATFNWTVPAGATISSGAGTSAIAVDWGDTGGVVSCEVTNGCTTTVKSINVTVAPNYVYDFTFENFDAPGTVSLNSFTGSLTEVSNPDASGVNTSAISAEYIRNSQEQYDVIAYSTSAIADADVYSERLEKFYMDVLTQAPAGAEILIQLENSAVATATNYPSGRHSRYVGKVTQNGSWERIAFDLLDQPDGTTDPAAVDRIIVLFASNSFTGDTYYWDNFDSYIADTGSGTDNVSPVASFTFNATDLAVDFDGGGSTDSDGSITAWSWDFGDGTNGSGANVSHTYAAVGDYTVALTVTDNEGATGQTSQVVSVTSSNTGGPVSMHVQSIVTGTASAGRGSKSGTAVVTIHDDQENPVANATVSGNFSGTIAESVWGVTGADGTVTLNTTATASGNVMVNFCVTDVTHASLAYDAGMNDITCTGAGARLSQDQRVDYVLEAFPNPASEQMHIALTSEREGTVQLKVISTSGEVWSEIEKDIRKGNNTIQLDVQQLPEGLYFISGTLNDRSMRYMFMKH